MRRVLRFVAAVGLGAGLAGMYQPGALTKGPDSARIEGGGQIARITNDRALQDLMDVTSFGDLYRDPVVDEPARKGTAYVVTYVLGRNAAGKVMEFRQVLYPESSSGSVIYTAPRQWEYGATVRGGWTKSPVNLSPFLRSNGITVPGPAAMVPDEDRPPVWWSALVLLVTATVLLGWRSRRRVDSWRDQPQILAR